MAVVNVIYHHYPHYRRPVMHALVRSGTHEYRFWGSTDTVEGIRVFEGDEIIPLRPLRFHMRGRIWIVRGYLGAVLDPTAQVLIVHGNPNMPASWVIGALGRLLGKKVVYWVHGWLKKEPWPKAKVRNLHYRLGHVVMTYAERAKSLAAASGFPAERVVAVYNSLDWPAAKGVLHQLEVKGLDWVREHIGISDQELNIVCVARLTDKCRFDVLFDAMKILDERGFPSRALLIGDGDRRSELEERASLLGVNVSFLGAIYEEATVGAYIYGSDVTVSPGKVGLTAMHSLMYGTPVITHGDIDHQMPEVEAIEAGYTGDFFERDDPHSLAEALVRWTQRCSSRAVVKRRCLDMIEQKYNPETQARIINDVVTSLMS